MKKIAKYIPLMCGITFSVGGLMFLIQVTMHNFDFELIALYMAITFCATLYAVLLWDITPISACYGLTRDPLKIKQKDERFNRLLAFVFSAVCTVPLLIMYSFGYKTNTFLVLLMIVSFVAGLVHLRYSLWVNLLVGLFFFYAVDHIADAFFAIIAIGFLISFFSQIIRPWINIKKIITL